MAGAVTFQRTRALPEEAPKFGDLIRHVLVAIIIYDALFFLVHLTLHKSQTLYRLVLQKCGPFESRGAEKHGLVLQPCVLNQLSENLKFQ